MAKYPQLGDTVLYTGKSARAGHPIAPERAAIIAGQVGDGENMHLFVLYPQEPGFRVKRNIPHHEPGENELPKPETWRFRPARVGDPK